MTDRAVLLAAALLVLTAATAPGAVAAEDTVGASIQTEVFVQEDPALRVRNRSTVPARFDFTPSNGWTVDPPDLVLPPDTEAAVTVAGDGPDGATIAVRVTAAATPAAGQSGTEFVVRTEVFHTRPATMPWAVLLLCALAVLVAAVGLRRGLRRTPT